MSSDFDPYRTWLGIPPEDQPPNHYRLLGIALFEEQATAIEHAADRQMAHLRTLQAGKYGSLSQKLLNEVANARVCLLNAEKKAAYDQQLRGRMKLQAVGERKVAPPPPPEVTGDRTETYEPAPPAKSASKAAGQSTLLGRLGEYELTEQLGQGGMGTVYKATHTKLGRKVALKVLRKGTVADEKAVARFEREMRAVGAVDHPNIVRAMDAREIKGIRFLVTELVEGSDLNEVVRRVGPLPVADACELIRQAALGLEAVHKHDLVHRDVKPSNLMLTSEGQVKLLDLGLARFQSGQQPDDEMTGTGQALGTLDYMSPEQTTDTHNVDIRADIYSLGCTLYKLLTGHAPFADSQYKTPFAKMDAHLRNPPPKITQFRKDLPKELVSLVGKMLAKDPAKRFQTPAEVADAIGRYAVSSDLPGLIASAQNKTAAPKPSRSLEATMGSQSTGVTRFLELLKLKSPPPPPGGSGQAVPTKRPLVLGALGAGVLLVGLIFGGLWLTAGSSTEAVLVFNWPNEVRQETKLQIDGKWSAVPQSKGPIEHCCEPGEHRIVAQREGFKHWEKVVQLEPGDRHEISPGWQRQSYLVLQWPASQRQNAGVEVDGKQQDLSTLVPRPGPTGVKVPLDAGSHKVRITRQGFEPFVQTVAIAADKDSGLRPVWRKLSSPSQRPEPPAVAMVPTPPTPKEEPPVPSDDAGRQPSAQVDDGQRTDWVELFDGNTLGQWRAAEALPGKKSVGNVRIENGRIVLDAGNPMTVAVWTGDFPLQDYEFTLEAMRVSGHNVFCDVAFPVGQEQCSLQLGGYDGTVMGLHYVDDKDAQSNETTRKMPFENGRRYEVKVRITKGRIEAWIDGKEMVDFATAGHELHPYTAYQPATPFRLMSWYTKAAFRNIRVRRLMPKSAEADGNWISLLPSPTELIGWKVPDKDRGWKPLDEHVKYAGGVVELDSIGIRYPNVDAKDIVLRARVKKLSGSNLGIHLRCTASGSYHHAWFNGGNSFGIGKKVEGQGYRDLKTTTTDKKYNAFFEMEFSAIGDTFTLRVDGQEIIRVRDQSDTAGSFGIGAKGGRSEFSQVEVRILDKGWTPPPALALPRPTKVDDEWISLLRSPDKLIGWKVPDKDRGWKVPDRGVNYAGGVVELDSAHICYPAVVAKDIVIRAKVKKFSGNNVALHLRDTASNSNYGAFFRGGNSFGIGKVLPGEKWRDIKALRSDKSYNGPFEMEFSAIGDTLILRADGQEIIRVHDQSHDSGTCGIGASDCRGEFSQVEVRVLDKDWTPPLSLAPPPKPKLKPKPVEIDPALKLQRELDAKFAAALEPVEAMVSAWNFSAAVTALAKIKFDEPELMSRRNARGRELQRLVKFKTRIVAKINAADPPLKKSDLMIKGLNGRIVEATEQGMTTELASGKSESFAWLDMGSKAPERLAQMVIDRRKPDDWLAAGLLALVSGDAASAEKHFDKARSLGTDIGPYLTPLAAATFARANELLEKGEFGKADAALAKLATEYADTPWFASNKASLDAARAAAKAGDEGAEAERLYAEAAELFKKKQLFDVRPLVEKLKADYPTAPAVTDTTRKPSFAELEEAMASLGSIITVRQDGKGDHKSIQAAIDAAKPNSLIEIQDAGPYKEKVVIRKAGLILRAPKGVWPIITSLPEGYLVNVEAAGTTIEHVVLLMDYLPDKRSCIAISARRGSLLLRNALVISKSRSPYPCNLQSSPGTVLDVQNCLIWGAGGTIGKCSVRNTIWHSIGGALDAFCSQGPCELRSCTILHRVKLENEPNVIADSIAGEIVVVRPNTAIQRCCAFRKGFMERAQPDKNSLRANPQFRDPKNLDYRLMPTSPCRGKASDGGDLGVRYTPEMIELCKIALELRQRGIIKF